MPVSSNGARSPEPWRCSPSPRSNGLTGSTPGRSCGGYPWQGGRIGLPFWSMPALSGCILASGVPSWEG
eukprot:12890273-Prorocentrum_lima.AAC.1